MDSVWDQEILGADHGVHETAVVDRDRAWIQEQGKREVLACLQRQHAVKVCAMRCELTSLSSSRCDVGGLRNGGADWGGWEVRGGPGGL